MLIKCIFYSWERSELITYSPCVGISAKGGKPTKKKDALTDQQVEVLLDTVKGAASLFVRYDLLVFEGFAGRSAGLQWDCVFLDDLLRIYLYGEHGGSEHNRPVVSTVLKTPAAKGIFRYRSVWWIVWEKRKKIPYPDYVIADSKGEPLAYFTVSKSVAVCSCPFH